MFTAKFPPGDEEKLRELILYICLKSEGDRYFASTKLNKLLFYSDFFAYLYLGKSMTEQEYQALEKGPAPRQFVPIREKMIEEKELHIRESNSLGKTQKVPVALREPHLSRFNGDEIALVDDIIEQFWNMSATQISEKSHEFLGWKLMDKGQTIPYSIALIGRNRELTEQELLWAKELEPIAQEVLARHAL